MKRSMLISLIAPLAVVAQDPGSARAAYQQQQMLAEVPRLIQQFDLLVQNQDALATRVANLESASAQSDAAAEIAALRAEVAELRESLRREQDAMRREIVADLSKRIATIPAPAPAPAPTPAPSARAAARPQAAPPPPPPEIGPHYEYVVEPGQTLSLIAKGFDTTVATIGAATPGLKPKAVRVGQKLIIPAEDVPPAGSKSSGKDRGGRGRR